ncbi:LacI family DNA-binding transcriptional regulator [Falsihalocynthiibacter sp. CO-5D18]|uniref:LacI family DNA-binding transcriptional regulator n=1 Tax=Falsihalocynthiibacter sp. CO-5D18 TaxID=3240872 RepID=UPI00350E9E9C
MNKKPTIIDVAAHAGVSKSTVSLVVQNSPLVKEDTRKLVQESMKALNYVRNRAAATLRGSGTGLVGLVINDLRNPFFTEFAASAQMAFSDHGLATVIANSNEDPKIQHQVIQSMLEHEVSALLISPCYGDTKGTFDAIAQSGIPTLQVLRQADMRADIFPFYSLDYGAGSQLAVEHLIGQGIREIAFVGGEKGVAITSERMSAYQTGIIDKGLQGHVFHGRAARVFGREVAFKLLREHPTVKAAICFNDLVALGMMSAFAQSRVVVGKDFFLIGFDDIEECSHVYPQLSSVHCDIAEFGRQSSRIVLDWLETGIQPMCPDRAPVHLEIRQSSVVPSSLQSPE